MQPANFGLGSLIMSLRGNELDAIRKAIKFAEKWEQKEIGRKWPNVFIQRTGDHVVHQNLYCQPLLCASPRPPLMILTSAWYEHMTRITAESHWTLCKL